MMTGRKEKAKAPSDGTTESACNTILTASAAKASAHSTVIRLKTLSRLVTNAFQSRLTKMNNATTWATAAKPPAIHTHNGGAVHNSDKQYAGMQAAPINTTVAFAARLFTGKPCVSRAQKSKASTANVNQPLY